MTKISTSDARKDFAKVVDAAYAKNERVVLTRGGRQVAAIVPIEDLELLEQYELDQDKRAIKDALAEQGNKKPKSWDGLKAELGLG